MSTSKSNKAKVKLPFPVAQMASQQASHNAVRPKPENYADQLFPPPRGTRRSMGKR